MRLVITIAEDMVHLVKRVPDHVISAAGPM